MSCLPSLSILTLAAVSVLAQASSRSASFEVADVKANKSGDLAMWVRFSHGNLSVYNASLKTLITEAYRVNSFGVYGGESWLASDRFDISAKADPSTAEADLRIMLQHLLSDRFQLRSHLEEKTVAIYALLLEKNAANGSGKRASKLQETQDDPTARQGCPGVRGDSGHIARACHAVTMDELASQLPDFAPRYFDRPVIDMTGLQGGYDFRLDWSPIGAMDGSGHVDPAGNVVAAPGEFGGVTIFGAVERLGLKLENRKHSLDVVVVESVNRKPTDN